MLKQLSVGLVLVSMLFLWVACQDDKSQTPDEPRVEMTGIPTVDKISQEIAQKGNDPELYALRSEAYIKEELFGEAVEDAEYALKLDSTNLDYFRLLAGAYFDNNQSRPATKTLERALELYPKHIPTMLSLTEMYLIIQQYDQALIWTDKIFKLNPQQADAFFLRGMVMKEMGDTVKAVNNFQSAVEADADFVDAYVQLGELFTGLGKPIAVQYFENALMVDSTNYDALWKMADYYHSQKDYEAATTWYEKAMYHYPQDPEIQYNAGLMQMDNANYEKAFWHFDNATKFEPTFAEAFYFKGEAAEKLGRKEEAIKYYQSAVNLGERWGWSEDALKRLKGE